MTLRTTSFALATAIVALAVTSLADGASAQRRTNWIPLADPAGGPNFFPLDEDARYQYRRGPQPSASSRLFGLNIQEKNRTDIIRPLRSTARPQNGAPRSSFQRWNRSSTGRR
jgi:hypothetical protein